MKKEKKDGLCSKCTNKAVYEQTNHKLCKDHFLTYVENKVFKTIKKYSLINKNDNVCVAASGGKDSLTVLYLVSQFCRIHHITFFALAIDEGIKQYRDHTLIDLQTFCNQYNVPLHLIAFKDAFGSTLDEVKAKGIALNKKPCTVCGIFRRTLLNRTARDLKATKLVTGHNLDDESQSLLMNLLKGNMSHNAALGPVTGLFSNDKFVSRVKPLYFITEKETRLFAFLKGFDVHFAECPNIGLSFRAFVRDQLNAIEQNNPGAKSGLVNSFLEILPLLKEKYRHDKPFAYCKRCGDACSGSICNACNLEEELK